MAECYRTIKNQFNTQTPKIKQILCKHNFEYGREFSVNKGYFCIYLKCTKCGKFKQIDYFKE